MAVVERDAVVEVGSCHTLCAGLVTYTLELVTHADALAWETEVINHALMPMGDLTKGQVKGQVIHNMCLRLGFSLSFLHAQLCLL